MMRLLLIATLLSCEREPEPPKKGKLRLPRPCRVACETSTDTSTDGAFIMSKGE
jgi:hypothetical protein